MSKILWLFCSFLRFQGRFWLVCGICRCWRESIDFTFHVDSSQGSFLDTVVSVHDGIITTSLHTKVRQTGIVSCMPQVFIPSPSNGYFSMVNSYTCNAFLLTLMIFMLSLDACSKIFWLLVAHTGGFNLLSDEPIMPLCKHLTIEIRNLFQSFLRLRFLLRVAP